MKKERNPLNVFNFDFSPWKYLSNWKVNIKYFFRTFRYAWDRATKGFCSWDCCDIDKYLLDLLPALLTKFKEENEGYPPEVESAEEWDKILNAMIYHFTMARDGIPNKYEDTFHFTFKDGVVYTKGSEKDFENYSAEEIRIQQIKQEHLEKGMALLTKYFWRLWW